MDRLAAAAAERTWYAVDPKGNGHELILRVGIPQARVGGDWEVAVSLGVIEPRPMKICGVDSWQAVELAMRFITKLAIHAESEGWRFFWKAGDDPTAASELLHYDDASGEPPRESR